MSAESKLFDPGKQRTFSPYLDAGDQAQLHGLLQVGTSLPAGFADKLLSVSRRYGDDGDIVKLRAICLRVAHFCEQGWQINVEADRISFGPPGIACAGHRDYQSDA